MAPTLNWQGMTLFPQNLGLKAPTPKRKDARLTFHTQRAVQSAIANFLVSFLFIPLILIPPLLMHKTHLSTSFHGWLPICRLLTVLKQNFSSIVTINNMLQELIRRWDTRTWRDISPICLLIYHWTTTHLYFRNIFWVTGTCYITNGRRFTKSALRILLLSTFRVSSIN